MQPPAPAGDSPPTGTGAAGRVVVAVIDPRPLVRSAIVAALSADPSLTVLVSGDTTAAALRALGAVDVVVAADPSWARGLRRVDPEPLDVADRAGLAALVRVAAAAPVPDGPAPAGSAVLRPAPSLTVRESAVLDCFARGLTAAEVAHDLGISPSAVAGAKRRVLSKLGVATPVEALAVTGRGRGRSAAASAAAATSSEAPGAPDGPPVEEGSVLDLTALELAGPTGGARGRATAAGRPQDAR